MENWLKLKFSGRLVSENRRKIKSRTGHLVNSNEYLRCKRDLTLVFNPQIARQSFRDVFKTFTGDCRVHIKVETAKDIDNIEKAILDVLQETTPPVIADDNLVVEKLVQLKRLKNKKGYEEHLEVWVGEVTNAPAG